MLDPNKEGGVTPNVVTPVDNMNQDNIPINDRSSITDEITGDQVEEGGEGEGTTGETIIETSKVIKVTIMELKNQDKGIISKIIRDRKTLKVKVRVQMQKIMTLVGKKLKKEENLSSSEISIREQKAETQTIRPLLEDEEEVRSEST